MSGLSGDDYTRIVIEASVGELRCQHVELICLHVEQDKNQTA